MASESNQLTQKDGLLTGFVSYDGAGEKIDGYLAMPADGALHPGVILVQEWWGIEPHIKDLCARLAREGSYVVLAPDLYHGKVVAEPNDAAKAAMALNKDKAVGEIGAAIDYLQSRAEVQPKKLGMTGFCMGGFLTWKTAEQENGELAAIAPFYAGRYQPTAEEIRKVTAPVLVIWGEDDGSIPAEQRAHIVDLLKQEGKTYAAHTYAAGHAFINDQHPTHQKEAADAAWQQLLAWFKQYLG